MTFIDNGEVEEVRRIVPEKPSAALVLGERLLRGEIHLPAFDDLAGFDLVARVPEGREGFVLRVVDEDVAIREEQDARLAIFPGRVPAARPELPTNLEDHDGLAGARRHREKQTFLSGKNGFDRAVDGDLLIVARRLAADRIVRGDQVLHPLGRVDSAAVLISSPKVIRSGEVGNARFRLLEIVDLDDLGAVGGIGAFEVEYTRIVAGLLHGIGRAFVADLRLDHGQRKIPCKAQQIVYPLGWLADKALAYGNDAAIRDAALLGDGMRVAVPTGRLQLGHDKFSAGVGFISHGSPPPSHRSSALRYIQFALSCRSKRRDPPTLKPEILPATASL